MNSTTPRKLLSFLLALMLCLSVIGPISGFAEDLEPICLTEDGAAFGTLSETYGLEDQLTADTLYSSYWVNSAVSESTMRTLLNQETLHPQRTGWLELDQLIESILAKAGSDADTYTKLRYAYDYLVKNVSYSWEGYSYRSASVTAYNSFTQINYLSKMTYEDGLQKSIPDDMANRTYHILKDKKGVCYDYAIAIAVIARYIGIESYVHTGLFIFEPYYGWLSGHHGWSVLILGGEKYVFDPQRDARNYQYNGKKNGYYFGIAYETAINQNNRPHYRPNYYDADKKANAERDASMLSMTANRAHKVTINVSASEGGTVQGGGTFITGNSTTITAAPNEGYGFLGWYDAAGTLLSQDLSYTFTITDDLQLKARFGKLYQLNLIASRSGTVQGSGSYVAGSVSISAKSDQAAFLGWYSTYGNLVSTEANYQWNLVGNTTLIAMFEGDVFYDLPKKSYYTTSAMAAYEAGLIHGMNAITFSPDEPLTRAMLVKILVNLEQANTSSAAASPFVDVDPTKWYAPPINWAYENGLIEGIDSTHFAPEDPITREQLLAIVIRYLEAKGYVLEESELNYTDADQFFNYARTYAAKAQSIGLILGYPDGSFQPKNELPRREGVTVLYRLACYMEEHPVPVEPDLPDSEDPETPDDPDTPDDSAGTDASDDTDTPDGSDAAGDTDTPDGSDASDDTDTPDVPATEPEDPTETPAPEVPDSVG